MIDTTNLLILALAFGGLVILVLLFRRNRGVRLPKLTEGRLYWFVRCRDGKVLSAIGFIRGSYASCVVGALTTHRVTGHGESWKDKLAPYIRKGYVEATVAKNKGLIPQDWQPPELSPDESELARRFTIT